MKDPVLVIKPLKVVTAALLSSVKTPAFVKAPPTVKVPAVLTVNCELVTVFKVPLIAEFPLESVSTDVAVLKSTLTAFKGPPETVTPAAAPAPIVNVPVAVKPPVPAKLIVTVGVSVLSAPIVAAPPAKTPKVLVNPPPNTILAAVVTAVDVKVPFVFVTNPVKVVIPVLLSSVKLPTKEVVPATVKLPVPIDKVAPVATVRFPLIVRSTPACTVLTLAPLIIKLG